jgi:hypothetical protein
MRTTIFIAAVLAVSAAFYFTSCSLDTPGTPNGPNDVSPKAKYDPITITCGDVTKTTIILHVTAGASGAPAGFSIQWVKHSEYTDLTCGVQQDNLWPAAVCKASFSGTPGCSIYNLGPNESIDVEIGLLQDEECGVGMDGCGADELMCGTEYVFRGFTHANSQKQRSDFTINVCCTTEACNDPLPGCALSQGYWKNHVCNWPAPFAPTVIDPGPPEACACDSVTLFTIGNFQYTQCQLITALGRTVPEGGTMANLGRQIIAAKIDMLTGWVPDAAVLAAINDGIQQLINANYNLVTGNASYTGPDTDILKNAINLDECPN